MFGVRAIFDRRYSSNSIRSVSVVESANGVKVKKNHSVRYVRYIAGRSPSTGAGARV